jgi:hypothetical protein
LGIVRGLRSALALAVVSGAVACGLDLSGTAEQSTTVVPDAGDETGSTVEGGDPGTEASTGDAGGGDVVTIDAPDGEAGPPSCSEVGAQVHANHCYFPLNTVTGQTWAMANQGCAAAGAHLVTITSAAEQTFVRALATGERFIGMRRDEDAGAFERASFKWITGEAANGYHNWKDDEPNGSISPAFCVRLLEDGQWADGPCDPIPAFNAICERE